MRRAGDFGELRSLLQEPASAAGWEALVKLVSKARWRATAEEWLPYAADYLDRGWPDHLREWPAAWRREPAHPAAALVRAVRLQSHNASAIDGLAAVLERGAPPLAVVEIGAAQRVSVAQMARVFGALPATVRRVALRDDAAVYGLARAAQLDGIEALQVAGTVSAAALDALVQSGRIKAARALVLGDTMDDAMLAGLLEGIAGGPLRELGLRGNPALGADAAVALAASPLVAGLTALDLSDTRMVLSAPNASWGLRPRGLGALATGRWAGLETLRLRNAELSSGHASALAALLAAAPALRTLELAANPRIQRAAASGLAALTGPLDALSLERCELADLQCAEALRSPALASMRRLDLGDNHAGPACAAVIAEGALAGSLERLGLSAVPPADLLGFVRGLEGVRLPRLEALDLLMTRLNAPLVEALSRLDLPALRTIRCANVIVDPRKLAPWGHQITAIGPLA